MSWYWQLQRHRQRPQLFVQPCPLGTRVRVENLRNGKRVVRIVDRGPDTCIIDVSTGVAGDLGFTDGKV